MRGSPVVSPDETGWKVGGHAACEALVSKYSVLTVRIHPAAKHSLEALSVLRRVPMWQLVEAAILAYVDSLPEADRRLLAQFSARRDLEQADAYGRAGFTDLCNWERELRSQRIAIVRRSWPVDKS